MKQEKYRTVDRICGYCKKPFKTFTWEVNRGKGKYCSFSCACRVGNSVLKPHYERFAGKNRELKKDAERKVHRAIKQGKIARCSCEVCGRPHALAHHEDYARPLDIIWLCTKHHSERHLKGRVGAG